ncbi:MAG: class I SAM-dependent methyltransferase [Elusimicrobia bacterium]|nr:class I SAM-dependent methyltransferase [Candidatus Liberimonas magnetica]
MSLVKRLINRIITSNAAILIMSPLVALASLFFFFVRKYCIERHPVNRWIFNTIGIYPIRDHYYDPLFNDNRINKALLVKDRELSGIDFNIAEQLDLLSKFHFNNELASFPLEKRSMDEFNYHNGTFLAGDAEYLYNLIRFLKPSRIIEIGCGNTTLLILHALRKNRDENTNYKCRHTCIEPYEQPWLEKLNIDLIRNKVENVPKNIFEELGKNDILFIDSSHIIRPQGDVLFEYQEVIPKLKYGVYVHIHDIFTPRDYLPDWGLGRFFFWNEQYLLEAFLSFNTDFKLIGSLNYLRHHYFDKLAEKCPILKLESTSEPTSFWITRK